MKPSAKQAFKVSAVCIGIYLMRYLLANVLSLLAPVLQDLGVFTMETISYFSSAYAIFYAAGQLCNGVIGDVVPPKFMVAVGLTVAGIAMFVFPVANGTVLRVVLYALTGFSLSMLRGPLVKTISENSESKYARIACAFLSCASCTGQLFVSIFAMIFEWKTVYFVSGSLSVAMAVFSFFILTLFEKIGLIRPVRPVRKEKKEKLTFAQSLNDVLGVFRLDKFTVYLFLGMVFEIVTTSITFWRPTLIKEYLGFSINDANLITTALTFLTTCAPFMALIVCRWFKERDLFAIRVLLSITAGLYAVMALLPTELRWLNVIVFLMALLASLLASGIMWSYYIPGLGKSGKVSSANGILDCAGYVGASVMNLLLADIVNEIGWSGTVFVWAGIMLVGALLTFCHREKKEA